MLLRSMSFALAILGTAGVCAPATAGPTWQGFAGVAPTPKSVNVSYADLDVTREPGARVLLARITNAADGVCGFKPSNVLDFPLQRAYGNCMNETVGAAIQASNAPLVAQLYHSSTGVTAATGGSQ